jgi:hypothetical protein
MSDLVFNPFTNNLDYDSGNFKGVLGSAPSSPDQGWMYINSGDSGLYIYYGVTWQLLHTLTPAGFSYFILEDATTMLLESGDKLALEA